jgi:uncharacterized repeat protein (TIGR01451 family)
MITRVIQRKRPRRSAFLLITAGAVASLLVAAVALAIISDSGSYTVVVPNSGSSLTADLGNATVEYIGSSASNQSSGTGLFDPFVRLQGSPTEAGYNTCSQNSCGGDVTEFQTKPGSWTHAILASAIPVVDCGGDLVGTLCWELFNDINEGNSAKYISLNEVEVWLTTNANITDYDATTGFAGATQIYDFTGSILIHDVNQGSGRGDLRYLIPVQPFAAGDLFVLYSKWGTTTGAAPDGKTWGSEGGFEEWKVRKAPNVTILKTANPAGPVSAGSDIGFDITVSNTGAAGATNVVITDSLPASDGLTTGTLDWSINPAVSGCSITGSVGSEVLGCTFATLASGASVTIHITSDTTAADCGVVSNTATIVGGASSTATVTVNCGAIQITKSAKHADTSGDTSANLDATFTITGPSPSTATTTVSTGADGVGCVDGLAFGSYSVEETTVPAGYAAPAATTVTVDNVASCADATFGGEALGVENTPLTDVDIVIDSQHDGATSTTIECWGPDSDPATDPPDYSKTVSDGTLSITDLDPTDPAITLNCQITVDP